jgi:two-component system sensor histidine kinase UhpB
MTGLKYQIQDDFNLTDESIQLTLYRVLQECLTNISRHPDATEVRIKLGESSLDYWLEVVDNGKGFDIAKQRFGFGISGMQQRIESVHGKLDFDTKPVGMG